MKTLLLIFAAFAAAVLSPEISFANQQACANAIGQVERNAGMPPRLMQAIALAESGRWDEDKRASFAWPWTINAEGQGRYFATKEAAVAEVQRLKARGVRSIDVGCMQVNLMHHPYAFASIEDAFDPLKNATYAAEFLRELYDAQGSWPAAVGNYHSATPELHEPYRRRVYALWNNEQTKVVADATPSPRAFLPQGGVNNWIIMRGRIMQVSAIGRR